MIDVRRKCKRLLTRNLAYLGNHPKSIDVRVYCTTLKLVFNLLQNGSTQSSEVGIGGVQESSLDDQQNLYQSSQPYNMYPGYMFGAPMYNYNGE